ISTGAANDIKQATILAEQMVRNWGMSELGPLSYAKGEEPVFLGREISQHRDYSETTAQKIDDQIHKLINSSYEHAKQVLEGNLDILHKLADLLLEKETVLGKELDELIFLLRPGIKLPSHKADDDEGKPAAPASEATSTTQPDVDDDTEEAQSDQPPT
ncbi:MAG: cell division protein FtsH, partial [Desulfobacterales bacterium]